MNGSKSQNKKKQKKNERKVFRPKSLLGGLRKIKKKINKN